MVAAEATWYPEAVPLKCIDVKVVAQALFNFADAAQLGRNVTITKELYNIMRGYMCVLLIIRDRRLKASIYSC